MSGKNEIIQINSVQHKILTIRGVQVILDDDLAELSYIIHKKMI